MAKTFWKFGKCHTYEWTVMDDPYIIVCCVWYWINWSYFLLWKNVHNCGLYHQAYSITVVWCQRISTEGRSEGM
jgi:hypothetical protein